MEEYKSYGDLKSVVLTYSRFRQIINRIDDLPLFNHIDRSTLNTDVITPFVWHAYRNEEIRHRALDDASEFWGESHILNLLQFLRNTWQTNPLVSKYSDIVKKDYEWFIMDRSTFSNYYRKKGELINKLRRELLSANILQSFEKIIKKTYEINHWFIVTF